MDFRGRMDQCGGASVDCYSHPILIKPTSFYEHYRRPFTNGQLISRESYPAQQVPGVMATHQRSPYQHFYQQHGRGSRYDDVTESRCVTSFTELQPPARSNSGWTTTSPPPPISSRYCTLYTVFQKNLPHVIDSSSVKCLPSKFFHCWKEYEICYKTISHYVALCCTTVYSMHKQYKYTIFLLVAKNSVALSKAGAYRWPAWWHCVVVPLAM